MANLENVHLTAGDVEKIAKWLNASHTRSAMIQGRPGNIALLPNLHYSELALFRNGLPVDIHTALDEVEKMGGPKKYALFAGLKWYPSGGFKDYVGKFSSVEEAIKHMFTDYPYDADWYHVVDLDTMQVADEGRK